MPKQKEYDIIVVGAGPAGSTFASKAASKGLSVLLVDKKTRIGMPVRCGEAVSADDLKSIINPRKEWISTKIYTFSFIPPNKDVITIKLNQEGYILNRKTFDRDLAEIAKQAGAEILAGTYINNVIFENDSVAGVEGKSGDSPFYAKSKLVIAADGVEGRIARFAGIKSTVSLKDLNPGYEEYISGISIDKSTCSFYLSNAIAPGGYIWVFPKSSSGANVGITASGRNYEEDNSLKIRLKHFLKDNFRSCTTISETMGGVLLARPLNKMVGNGIALIGDAARTVDPLSGGGIIWGMKSAIYASDVIVKLFNNKKELNEANLYEYQKIWMRNEGKQAKRLYNFKNGVYNLSDEQLNKIAKRTNILPKEKRTLINLFRVSFRNNPSLLLDVTKQFIGIQ